MGIAGIRRNDAAVTALLCCAGLLVEFLALTAYGASYADIPAWDTLWYAGIIDGGYHTEPGGGTLSDEANWAFFPLLPLLAGAFARVSGLSSTMSLILVSRAFLFASAYIFIKFVRRLNPSIPAFVAGAFVVLNPFLSFGYFGYTEPLFLCFSLLCLMAFQDERYLAAGLFGAALSASRAVGVAMLPALALPSFWRFCKARVDVKLSMLLCFVLIPLGLGLFMFYLYVRMGDAMAFSHVQAAWSRRLGNPLHFLLQGFLSPNRHFIYALMVCGSFAATAVLFRQQRHSLAVFTLLCTLIPLSTTLQSIPRFLGCQPGILLALCEIVAVNNRYRYALPAMAVLLFCACLLWLARSGIMTW